METPTSEEPGMHASRHEIIVPRRAPLGLIVIIAAITFMPPIDSFSATVPIAIPTQISPITDPARSLRWKARFLPAEKSESPRESHPGFALAQQHCTHCHLTPLPEHESRETWPFVLNWMGNYLGYPNYGGRFNGLVEHSLIPESPIVNEEQLQLLSEYFQLYAQPEQDIREINKTRYPPISQFRMVGLRTGIPPGGLITMVHFDDERDHFYLGWGNQSKVRVHDINGKLLMEIPIQSEPIHLQTTPNGFQITGIGHFVNQAHLGHVMEVQTKNDTLLGFKHLVEGHTRMTQALRADVDSDGSIDLVLVGFGDGMEGEVSVRWGSEDQSFSDKTVLLDYSGGLNAAVHDFDADGSDDIMLLTSQRQQELLIFLNNGDRTFDQRTVLKKFAGFGFNHFALEDFNKDGQMDVVLSNGNNTEIDFSPIKPYHGIQVLENQGDLSFTQKYRFQLYGATKSVTGDFDQDGDPDIAAIAFYPDWKEDIPVTFAYLENRGAYQFLPSVVKSDNWGRWISIAKGDVNNDGYPDLLLGGAYYPIGVSTNYTKTYLELIKNRPSVVLLKNYGEQKKEPYGRDGN